MLGFFISIMFTSSYPKIGNFKGSIITYCYNHFSILILQAQGFLQLHFFQILGRDKSVYGLLD